MNPKLLRPLASGFNPRQISGLALWLDGADSSSLYTTDAGPVTAVSAPTDISGCIGWWDASDAATVTESGGVVSQVTDKSGQGNTAAQATPAARPSLITNALNGRSVLRFAGAEGLLGTLAATVTSDEYSVFAVCKMNGTTTNGRIFSTAGGGSDFASGSVIPCCANSTSSTQLSAFNGATGNVGGVGGFDSYAVFSGTSTTSSAVNAGNGMRVTAASVTLTTDITRFGIGVAAQGGTGFADADIAEVVFYDRALSVAERVRIESWLAAKWGISAVHAPSTATSDPVGYWKDKSGNNRHATQATAANRPTVGSVGNRSALVFDGVNDGLSLASAVSLGTSGYSVSAVLRHQGGFQVFLEGGTLNPYMSSDPSSLSGLFHYDGSVGVSASGAMPANTNTIASFSVGPSDRSIFAQGALVKDGDGTSRSAAIQYIGRTSSAFWWKGRIAEIILYSRQITTSERRSLERYLARKWGITLAPQVSNADAQDWVNRVYAAGSTVSQPVADAVSAFVDGCQADGIWDAIKASCILCGADTLAGALVPLVGTAPTNNNFAASDYNRETGLVGDGSTTYLDSNRALGDDPQNDAHISAYATTADQASAFAGALDASVNGTQIYNDTVTSYYRANGSGSVSVAGTLPTGLSGVSRSSAANIDYLRSGSVVNVANASASSSALNIWVFARNYSTSQQFSAARIAFYSIGESLDLAALDTRVSALITAIGAAI